MAKSKTTGKKYTLVPLTKPRPKIIRFFQGAWEIIRNKRDTKKHFTNATLALTISLFLNLVAILLVLAALRGIVLGIQSIVMLSATAIVNGIIRIAFAVLSALFALILRGMANEAERERESNYLVSLFSGLTGFVALIVAVIALSKGVG